MVWRALRCAIQNVSRRPWVEIERSCAFRFHQMTAAPVEGAAVAGFLYCERVVQL